MKLAQHPPPRRAGPPHDPAAGLHQIDGCQLWEALCADCGFRLPDTLKAFSAMAQARPTAAERALLGRMGDVFDAHCQHARSMTAGVQDESHEREPT